MVCKIPLLLPRRRDLLSQHLSDKGMLYYTDLSTLQLTVWKPSGIPSSGVFGFTARGSFGGLAQGGIGRGNGAL